MFDFITGFIDSTGYLGIAALMLLENLFPPIPSEMIMPLAGFAAARGDLSVGLVIAAGTAGSLLGTLPWYAAGRWIGCDALKRGAARHGRWFTVSPADIDRADAWFDRHGGKAVLLGRMVPAVRTLISLPAGLSEMPLLKFLAYSGLGTAAWTALLAVTGYLLEERYHAVADHVNPVSNVVIAAIVLGYCYRLATFGRARKGRRDGAGD